MTSADTRKLAALAIVISTALSPAALFAQGAAAAEALFREGRELLKAGKIDEACNKLAESQRIDPSPGTLHNLAECRLKQGKTASAWATFIEAANLARNRGDKREAGSRARADDVAKELSYLTIEVSKKVPGLQIKHGDVVVQEGSLSTKIPVDPGAIRVEATAPGHKSWSSTVEVARGAGVKVVKVPALEPAPEPAPSASAAPPPPSASTATAPPSPPPSAPAASPAQPVAALSADNASSLGPTVGWVLGGVGLVALGAGAYFGVKAGSTYDDAKSRCPTLKGCDPAIKTDRDRANTQANIANVAIGAGVVAVGVGAFLIIRGSGGDPPRATSLRVSPALAPTFAGAAFSGGF